jgi:RNA polymerase sigma-70 factor (ECF subfamily)
MTPPETPEIYEKRRRFESTALPFLRDLSNVARRLTHRDEDARDLVQETWLRAYRTFDNFRMGTNCKAWLLTILYSIFINQYRKVRREPEPASLEELEERFHRSLAVEAEVGAAAGWSDSEVEAAFHRLPASFREVLLLIDIEELSYEEAAVALACPVGTVRSRLFRGRQQLYASLQEHARRIGFLRETKDE